MRLIRKGLKVLHPILRRVMQWYLSGVRFYRFRGIRVKILPGVFHPGLFYSTRTLIRFVDTLDLRDKRLLELGAGSGLLALYCARRGARVTASDINPKAIKGLLENAAMNQISLEVAVSDLFERLDPDDFDIVLINPPYYPRAPEDMDQRAWYCGPDFEYFHKLFREMADLKPYTQVYMILSEDCSLEEIQKIAIHRGLIFDLQLTKRVLGEMNFVYQIRKRTQ